MLSKLYYNISRFRCVLKSSRRRRWLDEKPAHYYCKLNSRERKKMDIKGHWLDCLSSQMAYHCCVEWYVRVHIYDGLMMMMWLIDALKDRYNTRWHRQQFPSDWRPGKYYIGKPLPPAKYIYGQNNILIEKYIFVFHYFINFIFFLNNENRIVLTSSFFLSWHISSHSLLLFSMRNMLQPQYI